MVRVNWNTNLQGGKSSWKVALLEVLLNEADHTERNKYDRVSSAQ